MALYRARMVKWLALCKARIVYGRLSVTKTSWLNGWASVKHARFTDDILNVFWLALCRARMVKMVGPL